MQFEHIDIEASLQPAAMQRLADQFRAGWNHHLGEIATAGYIAG